MLQDHKGNKKTSNKLPIVNYYHENNSKKLSISIIYGHYRSIY